MLTVLCFIINYGFIWPTSVACQITCTWEVLAEAVLLAVLHFTGVIKLEVIIIHPRVHTMIKNQIAKMGQDDPFAMDTF